MAKPVARYVCQNCGSVARKWAGRCEDCGEWNSIVEEQAREVVPKGLGGGKGSRISFVGLEGKETPPPRLISGIGEFDRVSGGGLVPGSAVLIGGDPGIGKSTLLLQVVGRLAAEVGCAYISGEESIDQVRLRARRFGLGAQPVQLAAATSVRDIVTSLDRANAPQVVVIDSIQTMYVDTLDSAPGSVAQVRSAAQELIRLAKRRHLILLLVGHVTKDGVIAGPRVLEHMVDTVLYFEGERGHQFRLLRAVKNRYGPTDEIGVFEMTGTGLAEVTNPSELFLAGHSDNVNGTVVFAGIEGTRPVLVEIQALVSPTALGTARRAVVGWDSARLAMVLAVLQTRCGVNLAAADVYLNVAGGLRISEPAADLAVAAALISAHLGQLLPTRTVVFGEIGLGGEVRAVGQSQARLKEAEKLGFTTAIVPPVSPRQRGERGPGSAMATRNVASLQDLFTVFDDALTAGKTAAQ